MTREDIQAEIDRLQKYRNESVFCAALINRLERELDESNG